VTSNPDVPDTDHTQVGPVQAATTVAVFTQEGALGVQIVDGGQRARLPLADELARCYPPRTPPRQRFMFDPPPQWWPAPPELNEPLERPVGAGATAERCDRQHRREAQAVIDGLSTTGEPRSSAAGKLGAGHHRVIPSAASGSA
jgi:hypothetical protein